MRVERYKGMRDFYPEDWRREEYLFAAWKGVAKKFGYEEVEGPLLEPVEAYQKSGQEVPAQLFSFEDKSGQKIALRPELTPSLARMVAQRKDLQFPIRWFSIPRCFRYEAMQSGRGRDFFQFNLDLLGPASMQADAEVIATAVGIMKALGLTKKEFFVRLSNRKLVQGLLEGLGIQGTLLQDTYRILDKREKLPEKDFEAALKALGVTLQQIRSLEQVLKMKTIKKLAGLNERGKQGLSELQELLKFLRAYKVAGFCEIDFSIMRGFDYYTSTVFEVFDRKKELRAIAGGGRYENLVADFSGTLQCPGVGYGMGDMVLSLLLERQGKLPKVKRELDFYVAPVNEMVREKAVGIALKLMDKGSVEVDVMQRSLRKQLDYANSIRAKQVVIVGEKDLAKGRVTIREMKTGKEKRVGLTKLGR